MSEAVTAIIDYAFNELACEEKLNSLNFATKTKRNTQHQTAFNRGEPLVVVFTRAFF